MKGTIKHSLVLALSLLLNVMFGSPADAATSVVHDPAGDSSAPAAYLDVVHARVIEQQGQGTLLFMLQVAAPIPEEPPSGSVLIWAFHLDTNTDTSPDLLYNEYIVRVRWSNGVFAGHVVDRTAAPILIPKKISISIDGTTVKASVPLELLGYPSHFGWNAATRPAPPAAYLDIAPDGCDPSPEPCGLAAWAQ